MRSVVALCGFLILWSGQIGPAKAATPVPLPSVAPRTQREGRSLLTAFSHALVLGHDRAAKHYLAPDFRGRCGPDETSASMRVRVIMCGMPRPLAFTVFQIEPTAAVGTNRPGRALGGLVLYRLRNGRQPMQFLIAKTRAGRRITWIAPPQG